MQFVTHLCERPNFTQHWMPGLWRCPWNFGLKGRFLQPRPKAPQAPEAWGLHAFNASALKGPFIGASLRRKSRRTPYAGLLISNPTAEHKMALCEQSIRKIAYPRWSSR